MIFFCALGLTSGVTQAQTVTNVVFQSDPGDDDTYEIGDVIQVDVQYGANLAVTGSPRLPITIGSTTRYAEYSSSASALAVAGVGSLAFKYTVQVGDNDTDGISVPGPVDLNSGTIRERGTTSDVTLSLGSHAITNDDNHKVSTPKPELTISAPATVTEGVQLVLTLTRTSTSGAGSFPVNFSVTGGEDFGLSDSPPPYSAPATFADGVATAQLGLTPANDRNDEPNGTLTITLESGTAYTVGSTSSVTVTVLDNEENSDPPVITSITPGDQAMTVNWKLPDDLGLVDGAAATYDLHVISLEVEYRGTAPNWDGNYDGTPDTEWVEYIHNYAASVEPISMSRLEEGAEYQVRIRLGTVTGNSDWSTVATGRTLSANAPVVTARIHQRCRR